MFEANVEESEMKLSYPIVNNAATTYSSEIPCTLLFLQFK